MSGVPQDSAGSPLFDIAGTPQFQVAGEDFPQGSGHLFEELDFNIFDTFDVNADFVSVQPEEFYPVSSFDCMSPPSQDTIFSQELGGGVVVPRPTFFRTNPLAADEQVVGYAVKSALVP